MRRLVGNPVPVDNGNGDFSDGFTSHWEDAFTASTVSSDPYLDAQLAGLIAAAEAEGFHLSPAAAFYAWAQVSDAAHANWLVRGPDKDDDFARARRFLIEPEVAP